MKLGQLVSNRVVINAHDLLVFTKRGTGGKDYKALCEALDRLDGTRIRTNIRTGDEEQFDAFGLINAASLRRKYGLDGRLLHCEVELSDWVFKAIKAHEVLTLHPDYFRLRKPTERRIYEIARKHCGKQAEWKIGLALLLKKAGSKATLKEFRRAVKHIAEHDHLPDYQVEFDASEDMVIFRNRGSMLPTAIEPWNGLLDGDVYHDARQVLRGWDPYAVEQEWRNWLGENEIEPKKPEAHFIKFCHSWVEKRGSA